MYANKHPGVWWCRSWSWSVRPSFVHLSMCKKYSSQYNSQLCSHMVGFFPSGCWAVVSMVLVWPHNSLFHELQGQKEMLYAVKLSLERRPWGLAEAWHAPFWQEESDLWAARSVWRVGKEVTCIFLKADEFHLGWQCHNNFQPFTPTSASLILLPVLAEAFINQYSSIQLPVAGVNGKEWQEWEVRVVFWQQMVVVLA